MCLINTVDAREKLLVKPEDVVFRYVRKGDKGTRGLQHAGKGCMGRNKWRFFCRGQASDINKNRWIVSNHLRDKNGVTF